MKKITALLLALVMALSLAACGSKDDSKQLVGTWSCTAFPAAAPPQPHNAAHSSSGNMIFFTVSLLFGKAFRYSTSFSA